MRTAGNDQQGRIGADFLQRGVHGSALAHRNDVVLIAVNDEKRRSRLLHVRHRAGQRRQFGFLGNRSAKQASYGRVRVVAPGRESSRTADVADRWTFTRWVR